MNCPVCGQEIDNNFTVCSKCGFEDLNKIPSDKEEYIRWLQNTVVPYGINYCLSKMIPSEAKRVRLVLGMEDGVIYSDEEVAKIENVCVNRIHQHKAKFMRLFRRLPCTIKLQELLNS